jgi:hypothetical protein
MTVAVITSMTAYLYLYSRGMVFHAASQPILLYVMVPLVLGLPLDVFHMQTRFYFLRTLVRLIFPIQPISFSDFFLADVLTSMAKVCDITFIIVFSQCYFLSSLLVISNLLKHMSKIP